MQILRSVEDVVMWAAEVSEKKYETTGIDLIRDVFRDELIGTVHGNDSSKWQTHNHQASYIYFASII